MPKSIIGIYSIFNTYSLWYKNLEIVKCFAKVELVGCAVSVRLLKIENFFFLQYLTKITLLMLYSWIVILIKLTFITFIFSGIFSLVKIRTVMKQDGVKTDKLEKLIARIGVFSILYTIPKCVIIGKISCNLLFNQGRRVMYYQTKLEL